MILLSREKGLIVALPFVACFAWTSLAVGADIFENIRIYSEPQTTTPTPGIITAQPPDTSSGCLTPKATMDLETEFYTSPEGARLRDIAAARKTAPTTKLTPDEIIATYKKANALLQDKLEVSSATFWSSTQHTAGINATVSIFAYDFAKKEASVNEGAGMSLPWRWYPWTKVANLQSRCRATTFQALFGSSEIPKDQMWFSLAPTIYFSKPQTAGDVALQPALLFTFMDLLHIGPGFNLSGPNQGNVVLFFGIGSSLK